MQFRTHPWHGELHRPTDDDADKEEEDAEFDDDELDDEDVADDDIEDLDELDDDEDFDDDEEGNLLDKETDEGDETGSAHN